MEYTRLGRTGLEVSRYCLGTMIYGSWGLDAQSSTDIIHRTLDKGVNFIDTADIYGGGTSEDIIGDAIRGRRDQLILATKFKIRTSDGPNGQGASRYRIMRQVELSLQRLKTDYIDLYQIHRPDPETPIDETLRAMDDLVRQGKVRYIGCSNFDAWRITESLWISEKMNLERFVTNQPSYSILDRYIEMEILPVSEKYGLSTLAYSPLSGGWLSGKYRLNQSTPANSRGSNWNLEDEGNQRRLQTVEQLVSLAEEKGCTLSQLSLAWVMRNSSVIPIVGLRNAEQLEDNMGALNVELNEHDLKRIDEIAPSPYKDFSK